MIDSVLKIVYSLEKDDRRRRSRYLKITIKKEKLLKKLDEIFNEITKTTSKRR